MRSRHGEEEENGKNVRDPVERRAGWNSLDRRSLVSRGCGVGFRTRTREVQHAQDAPAGHRIPGGTRLHGVPAVTVRGHVPGVRASPLVPNRPWRAEPPVWRSLLGTSAAPQRNRILCQDPTCWRAHYLGDGDVVSIAASPTSAYQASPSSTPPVTLYLYRR
ncbi:hypothetical protein MTO96_007610 [Rhipicephalus appendiculatus]